MSVVHLGLSELHSFEDPHRSGHATANFPGVPDGEAGKLVFGPMQLCSYERFAPGFEGFALHPHENVEIVTIVLCGEWVHRDSLGRAGVLKSDDVQVMSAGTGLSHEELPQGAAACMQLWFEPRQRDVVPRVIDANIPVGPDVWVPVVGPDAALAVDADVRVHRARLTPEGSLLVEVAEGRSQMLVVFDGAIDLVDRHAASGERLVVTGPFAAALTTRCGAAIALVDVPLAA